MSHTVPCSGSSVPARAAPHADDAACRREKNRKSLGVRVPRMKRLTRRAQRDGGERHRGEHREERRVGPERGEREAAGAADAHARERHPEPAEQTRGERAERNDRRRRAVRRRSQSVRTTSKYTGLIRRFAARGRIDRDAPRWRRRSRPSDESCRRSAAQPCLAPCDRRSCRRSARSSDPGAPVRLRIEKSVSFGSRR